jgi:hypothetical protein
MMSARRPPFGLLSSLCVIVSVLVSMTAMGVFSAAPAMASAGCPNEQIRRESSTDPATGEAYSAGLPDCRAYEMVSPPEKNNGGIYSGNAGFPVAVDGDAVGFFSQNAFGGAENVLQPGAVNSYIARRTASGWTTSSAIPSRGMLAHPDTANPLDGSPSALSSLATCGLNVVDNYTNGTDAICALRQADGAWLPTPDYPMITGAMYGGSDGLTPVYLGGASNLSDVLFQSEDEDPFLPTDTSTRFGDGLYEVVGLGGSSPELRLVNVDDSGHEIGSNEGTHLGGISEDNGEAHACRYLGSEESGGSYQAISDDGATIFFTACPSNTEGGVNEIYARVDATSTVPSTVDISDPAEEGVSECSRCVTTPTSAVYQGASADGSKVFFTTSQQLLDGDTDTTNDLYEYDFDNPPGQKLIQVSAGGAGDLTPGVGAQVQGGVVSMSTDGSHVYFVAHGVLTTVPSSEGQVAQADAENLYSWERDAAYPQGYTRFVGLLCSGSGKSGAVTAGSCPVASTASDSALWEAEPHLVQTTPDGRYLVFTTYAQLINAGPETDSDEAQDVYRYDSQTGQLRRVSIAEPSFPASENGNTPGMNAAVEPMIYFYSHSAALADINDFNRAISENGEYIVFHTPEQLQADDTNTGAEPGCGEKQGAGTGCDVYVWHEGSVAMVSDGKTARSEETADGDASVSASGGDVFFFTTTRLVGQDSDQLQDLYDARMGGGFPAPTPESSCSGDACQGSQPSPQSFGSPGSLSLSGAGNLTPPANVSPPSPIKPKALTGAQKLARALRACAKKPRKQRAGCETQARKRYGSAVPTRTRPKVKKTANTETVKQTDQRGQR